MWDPDTAWVGNEDGYAPMFNSNERDSVDFSMMTMEKEQMNDALYLPAECDAKMRSTWFDCEQNEHTLKTLDELVGMYEMSVGRGANFLLNIGPDCHGQLPQIDKARILELGEEIRRRYGAPVPEFGKMTAENGGWSVQTAEYDAERWDDGAQPPLVNRVMLSEDLTADGEIHAFRVYAHLPRYQSKRICVYKGDTVGHKAICAFPAIRTPKLTVVVEKGEGECRLIDMKVYYVK